MMSGFMFGLIIGYLSWHAFKPDEAEGTVPIERIGALLAVVGGATVLTLFPSGSNLFEKYGLGLGIGFFFTPVKKWLGEISVAIRDLVRKAKSSRRKALREEIKAIQKNWPTIERLVRHRLITSCRIDEREPRLDFINITDLQELHYSPSSVEYIMQHFAQLNVRDGVEYRMWDGKPSLFKKRW